MTVVNLSLTSTCLLKWLYVPLHFNRENAVSMLQLSWIWWSSKLKVLVSNGSDFLC